VTPDAWLRLVSSGVVLGVGVLGYGLSERGADSAAIAHAEPRPSVSPALAASAPSPALAPVFREPAAEEPPPLMAPTAELQAGSDLLQPSADLPPLSVSESLPPAPDFGPSPEWLASPTSLLSPGPGRIEIELVEAARPMLPEALLAGIRRRSEMEFAIDPATLNLLRELDADLFAGVVVEDTETGVILSEVALDSLPERLGLEVEDVLVEINGQVCRVARMRELFESSLERGELIVSAERRTQPFELSVRLESSSEAPEP
jgi:hypothetical protein